MSKHFRDIGALRGRYFGQHQIRKRIRSERLLGRARTGEHAYRVEAFEPRMLLAADVFGSVGDDATIQEYLDNPYAFNGLGAQIDDLIIAAFETLEEFEGEADIDVDLPALLDRSDDGEHQTVNLADLLAIGTQLADTGDFTEVFDEADIDLGELDLIDYGDAGLTLSDVLRNAYASALDDLTSTFRGFSLDSAFDLTLTLPDLTDDARVSDTAGWEISIDVSGVSIDPSTDVGNGVYALEFDLSFGIERVELFSFDLGRNADLIGLSYGVDLAGDYGVDANGTAGLPGVDLSAGLAFDTTARVNLNLTETTNPGADFDLGTPEDNYQQLNIGFSNGTGIGVVSSTASLYAEATGAGAGGELAEFQLQIGFLEILASGSFDLEATAEYELASFVSLNALSGTTVTDGDISLSGAMDAVLEVSIDTGGVGGGLIDDLADTITLAAADAEITLSATLFDVGDFDADETADPRTAPIISTNTSFDDYFGVFNELGADEIVTYLAQIRSFLLQFQNSSELFGFDLPFVNQMSLLGDAQDSAADLLDWAAPVQDLINNLITTVPDAGEVPSFDSLQELLTDSDFAAVLAGSILPDLTLSDDGRTLLTFGLDFEWDTGFTKDVDLGFDFGTLENFNLDAGGNVDVSADLGLDFLFGVDLGGDAEVSVKAAEVGLGLTTLFGATGANSINTNLTNSARFKLKVNGIPAFEVEVDAGSYANTAALVAELQSSIDDAVTAAGLASGSEPTFIVEEDANGRIVIRAPGYTLLTISELNDGSDNDFQNLGFGESQIGNVAAAPSNGILSGDATFGLIVDGAAAVPITVLQADTLDNTNAADLLSDLQDAIDAAGFAGDVTVVGAADELGGFRLVLENGTSIDIASINSVAAADLGLDDNQLSSRVQLLGDREIQFTGADVLPPDGILASDLELTVTLDGQAYGPVTVAVDSTNEKPQDLLEDIRAALQTVEVEDGITLAEFFDLDADGNQLVVKSFFEPVDSIVISENGTQISTGGTITGTLFSGLAADGQFDTSEASLNSVEFTVEVTTTDGTTYSEVITISDAGQTSIEDTIAAINAEIALNGDISGRIVAGLTGSRLNIAATSDDVRAIRVLGISGSDPENPTGEASVLGLQDGASAVAAPQSGGFIADVDVSANVSATATGSGSVDFGFLELDFGTITGGASASASGELTGFAPFDLGGSPGDITNVLTFENLFQAGSGADYDTDTSWMSQIGGSVAVAGSADLSFSGFGVSGLGATNDFGILQDIEDYINSALGAASFELAVDDILTFDPEAIILPSLTDMLEIGSFLDFNFGEIQYVFDQAADFLENLTDLPFLGTPLPFVGLNLADALGISDAFDDVVDFLNAADLETIQGLGDLLEGALEQLGINGSTINDALGLTFDVNSPAVIGFDIEWDEAFSGILPLNFSLAEFIADAGITLPGIENIANISGSANLAADFGAALGFSFGIDITDPLDPLKINTDKTFVSLTGAAEANEVSFIAALGPLAALIDGGSISLGGAGVDNEIFGFSLADIDGVSDELSILDFLDGTLAFDDLFGDIFDSFSEFNFNFETVLPIYVQFAGQSTYIGNLDVDALLEGFDDLGFFLGDLGAGVSDFEDFMTIQLPDFDLLGTLFGDDFLEQLGLLDTVQLFVEGLDLVLGTLGDLFDGSLLGLDGIGDIPLVGDAFEDAADFFDTIRTDVVQPLTDLIDQTPELLATIFEDILTVLNDTLGTLLGEIGETGQFVISFLNDAGDSIGELVDAGIQNAEAGINDLFDLVQQATAFEVSFDLKGQFGVEVGDVDFGVPALGLDIDGALQIGFIWDLFFGIGVNLDEGLYVAVDEDAPEILLEAFVTLPNETSISLGFLAASARNANLDEDTGIDLREEAALGVGDDDPFTNPQFNDLYGVFAFDLATSGGDGELGIADLGTAQLDASFGVAIDVDLELRLGVGGIVGDDIAAKFPSLIASVGFEWGLGFGDYYDSLALALPQAPEITFAEVGLDLGEFLTDTLGPIVGFVNDYIDPIMPLINLLTSPIPVISDLNGEVSLLDIAAEFGLVNQGLVDAIEAIVGIIDSLNALGEYFNNPANEGQDLILWIVGPNSNFGMNEALVLGGDSTTTDLTNPSKAGLFTDPTQALSDILGSEGLTDFVNGLLGTDVGAALNTIASGFTGGGAAADGANLLSGGAGGSVGLVFPFLEDPFSALGLLFGRDVDLIGLNLPPLSFGFDYSQFFSIWGPIGVTLGGAFSATFDFDAAYDTAGIRKFADGDFQNPLDLLEGFYFLDDSFENRGVDTAEITLYGEITAALAINIGVAEAGVGGKIAGTFEVDWNDPNGDLKVRFSEIIGNVVDSGNPLCVFDYSVLLEANLFVYVEALWGLWEKRWEFGPSLPLIDETIECTPPPVLGSLDGDILRLNMGDYAADRIHDVEGDISLEDVEEQFFVFEDDSGDLWIEAIIDGQYVEAQNYGNLGADVLILGRAGLFDDAIYMDGTRASSINAAFTSAPGSSNAVTNRADLEGADGNDILIGGTRDDRILGQSGADVIGGGAGHDTLLGGSGDDCIDGGAGNDLILGDIGNDILRGGDDNDVIDGEEGDDAIGGGAGDDVLWGREGDDIIAGGSDSDIISGDEGRDTIWGDLDLLVNNCVLDPAMVTTPTGSDGNDFIAGGEDVDWISADGGDDLVWGDSAIRADADNITPLMRAGSDPFQIIENGVVIQSVADAPLTLKNSLGKGGGDVISGGAGNDVLQGEDGNDVIRGDLFDDLANEDDRFDVGLTTDAAGRTPTLDGNDVMTGFKGADVIFGNAGNDFADAGSGTDFVFGNEGDDRLRGAAGRDVIFGDNGEVVVFEAGDTDRVTDDGAAASYDAPTFDPKLLTTLTPGVGGVDEILGGIDDDVIFGGAASDDVDGEGGRDLIFGDHGFAEFSYDKAIGASLMTAASTSDPAEGAADTLLGGLGADIIFGGTGGDTIDGDLPDDGTIPQSDDVILGDFGELTRQQTVKLKTALVAEITTVAGGLGVGSDIPAPANYGEDIVTGGGGADVIFGGLGADRLQGGRSGTGEGETRDIIVGDDGRLSYVETGTLTTVDGNALTADGDHLNFETSGALKLTLDIVETDVSVGAGDADIISGGAGDDIILAGGGADTVYGDDSFDLTTLALIPETSEFGADTIIADQGLVALTETLIRVVRSTAASDSEGGGDTVSANAGDDVVIGGVSNGETDTLGGAEGDDILIGDEGVVLYTWDDDLAIRDRIFSTSFSLGAADAIEGNAGDDVAIGGSGDDVIRGDNAGALIEADAGDDILIGDQGEVDYDVSTGVSERDAVFTTDTSELDGGIDTIEGDSGNDIIMGGVAGDFLYGEAATVAAIANGFGRYDDTILGDEGEVLYRVSDADSTTIDEIRSTDFSLGGDDEIFGGKGSDVAIGGTGGDLILGDNIGAVIIGEQGEDIAIGDQGELIFIGGERDIIQSTDTADADGGVDIIEGNAGGDILIGGVLGDNLYGEGITLGAISVGFAGGYDDVILGDEGEVLYRVTDADSSTIDEVRSDAFGLGGQDDIFGNKGSDILIGGTDADLIYGDNLFWQVLTDEGDDIALGDQGEVIFLAGVLERVETTDTSELDGGADYIEGNDGDDIIMGGVAGDTIHGESDLIGSVGALGRYDDIILGDEGVALYDTTNDAIRERVEVSTKEPLLGGNDTIFGNRGSDVVMGATGDDTIRGDVFANGGTLTAVGTPGVGESLSDILLGDHGSLYYDDAQAFDGATDTSVSYKSTLVSTFTASGGDDFITGDDAGDFILGGFGSDRLYGEQLYTLLGLVTARAGDDVILGDNGQMDWGLDATDGLATASSGILSPFDGDLSTLDRVMVIAPNDGAGDVVFGNGGNDAIMGGTGSDQIWGDSGDGGLLGGGPDQVDGDDGSDLVMGDHGTLYYHLAQVNAVGTGVAFNDFFVATFTGASDGGAADLAFGNGGSDILMGQQGDDLMFGGTGDDDLIGGHNVEGGIDELGGQTAADFDLGPTLAGMTPLDLDELSDVLDGGTGDDVIAGDNAIIVRQTDAASPRIRQVGAGGAMYTVEQVDLGTAVLGEEVLIDQAILANVGDVHEQNPDMVNGRTVTILDHSADIQNDAAANPADAHSFGNDLIVGGADDDEIWGQLGDDVIQGDGLIELVGGGVAAAGDYDPTQGADPSFSVPSQYLAFATDEMTSFELNFRVVEDAADGDDYIEGNGGNDRIYGNLGSDDIVGGSSSLFGLGIFDTVADPARPDGADLIYGAAGDAARLARGAVTSEAAGFDSDVILGDNGNIYRLVDANGDYRDFNYDTSGTIIPRPVDLLDYGYQAQFTADLGTGESSFTMADLLAVSGYGAGDLIFGEDGDDFIHGQTGDDVVFGNAGNDSLHGERGNDVLYGGSGEDGILGDDGLLKVSRLPSDPGGGPNATAFMVEELWGINEELQVNLEISTPGNLQRDIINEADSLRYSVDLLAFRTGTTGEDQQFNDIIFGGFGTDWMHGGDGDDAISGAEALSIYYDAEGDDFGGVNDLLKSSQEGTALVGGAAYDVQDDPFWYAIAIYNPGNILRHEGKTAANGDGNGNFGDVSAEFAAYDSYNPRDRVFVDPVTGLSVPIDELTGNEIEFILNFDANEGDEETNFPDDDVDLFTDGDDRIFGDLGNDWIVGGTGRDNMYGGRGNDLLNMDDQHDTAGMLNTDPDAFQAYADQAYGGAGRDVLILNTGADRAIDWVGEFNSYIVPFSPFGAFHISRSLQPHLAEFLLDLSESDGGDQTGPDFGLYLMHKVADARTDAPDVDRNYEPFGELGMVRQQDFDWGDQTGAPADPQAGNLQGQREIMRRALFADEPLQGGGGGNGGGGNGNGQGFAPTSGTWSVEGGVYNASTTLDGEAVSIFPLDEQQPTYMEILATVNADKDKAGFKSNGYILFDIQSETEFKFAGIEVGTDKLQIGQHTAEGGWEVLTQSNLQLKHETDYDLTLVMFGTVATLYVDQANATSLDFGAALNTGYIGLGTDNSTTRFDDWQVQKLPPEITFEWPADFADNMGDLSAETAMWTTNGTTLVGTPTGDPAIAARPVDVQYFSMLELEAVLDGTGSSGFVFDYYSTSEYKFATYDSTTDELVIGHVSNGKVSVDATATFETDGPVEFVLNMRGTQVNVEINGTSVAGHLYNAILNDGGVGLYVESGTTTFDSFVIRGDDPAYDIDEVSAIQAAETASVQSGETLDQAELEEMAAVALEMWAEELGVTVADLGITVDDFLLTDLAGDQLASSRDDGRILVDLNAAGHGWFIDDTPEDDADMGEGMDLLSALLHEIGHQLDYDHDHAEEGSVMDPFLSEGERLNFAGFTEDDDADDGSLIIEWTTDPEPVAPAPTETKGDKGNKSTRPDFLYELDDLDTIADPTKVAAE